MAEQVHILYDGHAVDLNFADLDVGLLSSDSDVRNRVAEALNVPAVKLSAWGVERNEETADITLTPPVVFGLSCRRNLLRGLAFLPFFRISATPICIGKRTIQYRDGTTKTELLYKEDSPKCHGPESEFWKNVYSVTYEDLQTGRKSKVEIW